MTFRSQYLQFATQISPPSAKIGRSPRDAGGNKQGEIMAFFPFWVPEGLGGTLLFLPPFKSNSRADPVKVIQKVSGTLM